MRKNGFTLIELLAVIVILAIIALIVTPIILGIIKDAKEQANQRSVDNYAKAVQNAVVRNQLSENNNISGCFTPEDGTNLTLLDETKFSLMVEYEGSSIKCNTIEIYKDGNVYLDECVVNGSDKKYSFGNKQGYNDGDIVYFDVYNGVVCTEDDYLVDNSKTGYNGIYEGEASRKTTNNQNGCLKFYAFNDSCGDKINLLLDHNTTATLAWDSSGSNTSGPKEVLEQLKIDTDGWSVPVISKNYTYNHATDTRRYTINYNTEKYKARLITAQEIAEITGADKEDTLNWGENLSTSAAYYFDSLSRISSDICEEGNTTGCMYGWLYDRTSYKCTTYGCLNNSNTSTDGYWTSSAAAKSNNGAWRVYYSGYVCTSAVDHTGGYASNYGVRPVIEVLKSNL